MLFSVPARALYELFWMGSLGCHRGSFILVTLPIDLVGVEAEYCCFWSVFIWMDTCLMLDGSPFSEWNHFRDFVSNVKLLALCSTASTLFTSGSSVPFHSWLSNMSFIFVVLNSRSILIHFWRFSDSNCQELSDVDIEVNTNMLSTLKPFVEEVWIE